MKPVQVKSDHLNKIVRSNRQNRYQNSRQSEHIGINAPALDLPALEEEFVAEDELVVDELVPLNSSLMAVMRTPILFQHWSLERRLAEELNVMSAYFSSISQSKIRSKADLRYTEQYLQVQP